MRAGRDRAPVSLVVNTGERERPMRRINYSPELLQPAGECMSSVGDWCCMSVYS